MNRRLFIVILILLLILIPLITLFVLVSRPGPDDEWGWLEEYSSDQEYFTALEAYHLIKPLMTDWNHDSFIANLSAGYLWADDPLYDVQADGRIRFWHFVACSPLAGKWVSIVVHHGEVGLGVGEKPWGYLDHECQPMPLENVIDSDEAIRIAMDRVGDIKPEHIRTGNYSSFTHSFIPASWLLDFTPPEGGIIKIIINASSGDIFEVVRSFEGDEVELGSDWYRNNP